MKLCMKKQTRAATLGTALVLAVWAGVAGPRAARALPSEGSSASGSIVFVKGGNVWLAAPDGSSQRRVTRDGTAGNPYTSPTQADNGTIVALRDTQVARLGRTGKVLGRPFKVAVGLHNAGPLHELASRPAVSPDGKKVAVFKSLLQGVYNAQTGVRGLNLLAVTVEYRNAVSGARLGVRHTPGTYLQSPSWIDDSRLLVFAPYNSFAPQVFVDSVGGGLRPWFSDDLDGDSSFDRKLLDEGELTRSGDRLAAIRGSNVEKAWRDASITVYSVRGLSAKPPVVCTVRATNGPLEKPTWSPDGGVLAWSDRAGIWSSPVVLGAPGCGLSPRLIVRGARSPDWGAAAAA